MTMKTAKFVKKMDGFAGDARLYHLSEPMSRDDDGTTDYVVVSAVLAPFTGPETYIFACDEAGNAADWSELEGSFRGGMDHEEALRDAGYEVTD